MSSSSPEKRDNFQQFWRAPAWVHVVSLFPTAYFADKALDAAVEGDVGRTAVNIVTATAVGIFTRVMGSELHKSAVSMLEGHRGYKARRRGQPPHEQL